MKNYIALVCVVLSAAGCYGNGGDESGADAADASLITSGMPGKFITDLSPTQVVRDPKAGTYFACLPPAGAVFAGDGTAASPYLICTTAQLLQMPEYTSAHYLLVNDLTFPAASAAISPLGAARPFRGVFDGGGHQISGFTITRDHMAGLFALLHRATVRNLRLHGSVSGPSGAGLLAGSAEESTIENVHVSGSVTGELPGGIVGALLKQSTIRRSSVTAMTVSGVNIAGGITSMSDASTIEDSFSLATVSASAPAGQVAGISPSFARSTLRRVYSAGSLTGTYRYGLNSWGNGQVLDSYWDSEVTGLLYGGGGIGTSTAAMRQQATFVGWDFTTVWKIAEGTEYPNLR